MYGSDHISYWRKEKRICSPDLFHTYFKFSLPPNSVSTSLVKTVLATTDDQSALESIILELANQTLSNGKTKLSVILDRLVDYLDSLEGQQIINIINMIFNVGDKLLIDSDESRGMFAFGGNGIRLGRIMFFGLRQLTDNKEDRFNVLKSAFESGDAIVMMSDQTTILGQQHGKYSSKKDVRDDYLVELEHQEALEKIALDRIQNAAKEGFLTINSNTVNLLYDWRRWAENDEPNLWIKEQLNKDPKGLLFLLSGYRSKSYSHGFSDRVAREHERLNVKNLSEFISIDEAKKISGSIIASVGIDEKKLIELFFRECDLYEDDPDTYNRH